jgi:hypothetical protein
MNSTIVELLCLELITAINDNRKDIRLDTNSVYFARRFCTSCCREWGDTDMFLDLAACRSGASRVECYKALSGAGILRYGGCCTRAIFPCQHNITSLTKHGAQAVSCTIPSGIPSALRLYASRQRLDIVIPKEGQKPNVLGGKPSIESIEKILARSGGEE